MLILMFFFNTESNVDNKRGWVVIWQFLRVTVYTQKIRQKVIFPLQACSKLHKNTLKAMFYLTWYSYRIKF